MRTKQMKAFILAAIFTFESMVAGYGSVSVHAQTVPENSIKEAVETVQIASETADTEAEIVKSETADRDVKSETAVAEEDIAAETATVKYSGTDGKLDWSIDTDGHLTVSGNGDYVKRTYSSETGWLAHKDEIKSATVNVSGITNTSYMFNACNNLEKVDLSGLVMSNAENVEIDMRYMFHLCNSLKSLNLSSLDTSKVTNMDHMFYNCKNLTSLDLSGLVTSKVTNMNAMFMACESLTSLDLSNFDTKNVTDMTVMFSGCSGLESLNVSRFETGNVKMMMNMFYDCSSLTSLDISNFDTTNVINMGSMFDYCSKLKTINAPVDASTDADMMLPTRTDSSWIYQPTGETVRAVSSAGIYVRVCGGIDGALSWNIDTDDHLTVSGNGNYESRTSDDNEKGWLSYRDEFTTATVDVSQITDTSYMFYGCSNLESLDMSGLVTDSVTNMDAMFEGCISLNSINAPDNNSSVDMELPVLPDQSWVYSPTGETVTLIKKAGLYAKGATVQTPEPDADGFIIQNGVLIGYAGNGGDIRIPDTVTSIGNEAFNYCDTLIKVEIPDSVTSIGESAFCDCINLKSIIIPVGVSTIEPDTFLRCSSLESVTLPDSVTSIREGAFSNCSSLTSIDIPKDVTQIEDFVFYGCDALKNITIPTGVTSIGSYSFLNCNLETIQLPGSVTSISDNAFDGCNLKEIRGYAGSYAQEYATKKGIPFRAIVIDLPPGDIVDTGDDDEGKTPGGDGELKGGNESEKKTPVVENTTETKQDGSVVTTEKTTYPEGNVSMTIISTSKDQKKQTRVDMEIDAQKNLTSAAIDVSKKVAKKTMTINLKELKNMVEQIEKCNVEYVHPLADGIDAESVLTEDALSGSTEGTSVAGMSLTGKSPQDGWTDENIIWADELYVTAKKANISIKVTAKDNKGKDKYSLSIQKKDLTQKKFVVYSSDKKGSPVMTNPKSNYVKVNAKKDMTIKIASKGNYQLQNNKDAAKTNQKIMKTVTPAKTKVTVKPGSSTKFALSAKCNKANISKITYKADSSKVSVAKSGKISAKSSGTAKVTANVTMKNGAKKSIKMKVSVS